jgi:diaminopimelate decarboxylase
MYNAWQEIIPLVRRNNQPLQRYDVVGPVCETGDFLGKDRELAIQSGDILAIRSAGAYGFVMSSNYNSRPRAPEILVDGDQMHLIRPREQLTGLFSTERLLS